MDNYMAVTLGRDLEYGAIARFDPDIELEQILEFKKRISGIRRNMRIAYLGPKLTTAKRRVSGRSLLVMSSDAPFESRHKAFGGSVDDFVDWAILEEAADLLEAMSKYLLPQESAKPTEVAKPYTPQESVKPTDVDKSYMPWIGEIIPKRDRERNSAALLESTVEHSWPRESAKPTEVAKPQMPHVSKAMTRKGSKRNYIAIALGANLEHAIILSYNMREEPKIAKFEQQLAMRGDAWILYSGDSLRDAEDSTAGKVLVILSQYSSHLHRVSERAFYVDNWERFRELLGSVKEFRI